MSEKKNIDRLFKEQFKDFEATPATGTWDQIAARLPHNKKRKVVPFWLKATGIAASLFLGLFLYWNQNQILDLQENKVVTTTEKKDNVEKNSSSTTKQTTAPRIEHVIATPTAVIKTATLPIAVSKRTNKAIRTIGTNQYATNAKLTALKALAQNANKTNEKTSKSGTLTPNQAAELLVEETKLGSETLSSKTTNAIVNNTDISSEKKQQTTPNALEILLQQKTEGKEVVSAAIAKKKWEIKPNLAPLFMNTQSKGSSIDAQFANNPKSAEQNLSYGLGVQYALNKKVKIRSGINKLALDYNTKNIVYSTGLMSSNIPNINFTGVQGIEIKNQNTLETLILFEKDLQKTNSGEINQQMGYIELPMEVSYALLDKKLGINVIGGLSTLFLTQNKIAIVGDEGTIPLGEANNLNSVHLSSNLGLGFSYQIKPSLRFNLEPMMKYQLNTFSRNNSGFKPAFVGLYSGLSFSF